MKRRAIITAFVLCATLVVGTVPSAYADTTDDGRLVNGRALGSSIWGAVIDPLTVPNTFKTETGHGRYEYTVAASGIYTVELWADAGVDNSTTSQQDIKRDFYGKDTYGKIHYGGRAGKGGYISGTAKLKKGDNLYFDLGTTAPGGYGGSGTLKDYTFQDGKNGGAATTLYMGGTQSNNRVLVAGGGAGGGGLSSSRGLFTGAVISGSNSYTDGVSGGAGGSNCNTGEAPANGVGGGGGGAEGTIELYGDYWSHAGTYTGKPGGTGGPNGTGGTSGRGGDNYVKTTIFTDHSSVPGESQSCKLKITLSTGGGMDTEDVQKILEEIGYVKGQINSLDSTVATKGDVTGISETLTSTKDQVTALQTSMGGIATKDQIAAVQTSIGGINALLLDMQKRMTEEKKTVTVVKDKPFDIMLFRADGMDEKSNVTTEQYNINLLNTVPKDGIVELQGVVNTTGYVTVTFPDGSSFVINSIKEPDSGNVEVIFH